LSSLRSQLHDDPDALLLLHAAGELPTDEQQAVQTMLDADGELRTRLNVVRSNLDALDRHFAAADAGSALRSEPAMRRAVEAIRNWQLGRSAAMAQAAPAIESPRRRVWGWPSAAAALIAVGLGGAAVISYLQRDRPRSVHLENLPEAVDPVENALALHAATSLAVGSDLDDETPPAAPMPPTEEDPLGPAERPVFDIPLIADADAD